MQTSEQITVAIPSTLAAAMRARVASGEFASEDAAVTAALEESEENHAGLEAWLRGPVSEAYDDVMAGTATLYTVEEVRERLGLTR